MKKMIISAFVALGCLGAFAATQYKVYDFKATLTTTEAKGVKTCGTVTDACGPCGEAIVETTSYVYRDKVKKTISGVIAGCGCEAAAGDPTCLNFDVYFWDAASKKPLKYEYKTEILQRIGKTGKTVEHVATFKIEDDSGAVWELQLAGFGTYKASKSGSGFDNLSVTDGAVTGVKDAPYLTIKGKSTVCGETVEDATDQSTATIICGDACEVSETGKITPVKGTYRLKYNKQKSAKAEKSGAADPKVLGVPSWALAQ